MKPESKSRAEEELDQALQEVPRARALLSDRWKPVTPLGLGAVLRSLPGRLARPVFGIAERSQLFLTLGIMLEAGCKLPKALEQVLSQSRPEQTPYLTELNRQVLDLGWPLSRALAALPDVVRLPDRAFLAAAEHHGRMGATLQDLGRLEDRRVARQRRLQSLLLPPTLMALAAWLMLIALAGLIHHLMGGILREMAPNDPLIVWGLRLFQPAVLLAVSLLGMAFLAFLGLAASEPSWRLRLERFTYAFAFPRTQASLRLARLLGQMLSAGVTLGTALRCLQVHESSPNLQRVLHQVERHLLNGSNLHSALANDRFFPPLLVSLVESGESTGTLDRQLLRYADLAEADQDYQLEVFLNLLSSVLITLPGLLVGLVAIVGLGPILKILESL